VINMVMSIGKSACASVHVAAPLDTVWALIADVTRVGEWSVECRGCTWLDGATEPGPGVRFRGHNRRNATMWSRTCVVDAVEPMRRFAWHTVPTRLLPDSTAWSFELEPDGAGVRLTESMQVLRIPRAYDVLFALVLPQHRDRSVDLEADLLRIKARAETAAVPTPE
jgi:hypothetical protein